MTQLMPFVLGAAVLTLAVLVSHSSATEDMHGPPVRPKVFKSPESLRQYLKELNEYFAIVGRPRFGKRDVEDEFLSEKRADYLKFDLNDDGNVSNMERDYLRYLLYGYRK